MHGEKIAVLLSAGKTSPSLNAIFITVHGTPHILKSSVKCFKSNACQPCYRKQFLTFRIGPDTPKIGELLKTTCSEDEDDELEGTEVEVVDRHHPLKNRDQTYCIIAR